MAEAARSFRRQGIDFLGFLQAKLRDLQVPSILVSELVQNADDAPGVTKLSFDVRDDGLRVWNNGSFRDTDFDRMQNVATGGKREEENTTGAFGIGFIAVYQITDHPELFSSGRHWIFRPEEPEEKRILEEVDENRNDTVFWLPWATDPQTQVRQQLRLPAISEDTVDRFANDLNAVLPNTLLFVRKLEDIELRRNGTLLKRAERILGERQLLVHDGSATQLFHLCEGSFAAEAKHLRTLFDNRIETKRSDRVVVAIPADPADHEGLLYAFLPTQDRTGMTVHVNADFFTSSDRKHILFDDGYQGQWNRNAILAGSRAVGAALNCLPQLLGHRPFWKLIASMETTAGRAKNGEIDRSFAEFWNQVEPLLSSADVVYTSTGLWRTPATTLLLESEDEEQALGVLEALKLEIVHPDLRTHHNLLRRRSVGVKILGARDLAHALSTAGVRKVIALEDAPPWLRTTVGRNALAREIEVLFQRTMSEVDRHETRDALSACALATGRDGRLHPLRELRHGDQSTVDLFERMGVGRPFVAEDNPAAIMDLIPELDPSVAVEDLASCPVETIEEQWKRGKWQPRELLSWLQLRRSKISPAVKSRLQELAIYPSEGRLRPLNELATPGTFKDPLRLSSLLDLEGLPGLSDFLIELGATPLTLETYLREHVPRALAGSTELPGDRRRELLMLLAQRFGEFSDIVAVREALRKSPLVECEDGQFREPASVYFESSDVSESLERWLTSQNKPANTKSPSASYYFGSV